MENRSTSSAEAEQDLKRYLNLFWRRKWIVIICVVFVTAAVFSFTSYVQTPQYESSTELLHRRSGLDKALLGSEIASSSQPERDMQTAAELVASPEVVGAVKNKLGNRLEGRDPAEMIEVSLVNKSDILRITATDSDAQLASDVANTFALEYTAWRRQSDNDALEEARGSVEASVAALPGDQRDSATSEALQEKLQTIQLLEVMQTGNLEIVEEAVPAASQASPNPIRSSVIAFLLSLTGGLGMALVVNQYDTRIRNIDDIEKQVNKPILATIPSDVHPSDRQTLATILNPAGPCAEAFRILKTNLSYADPDKPVKSILVSSVEPQEGKSTLVANLAITLARSGKRVVVLDADLRRPRMHQYLNLQNRVGITNIVAGECDFAEAVQEITASDLVATVYNSQTDPNGLPLPKLNGAKPIYCATSGPIPPNPGELSSSEKMSSLIQHAASQADIVIVDSPPLGAVADAAGMASKVDGVILLTNLALTSRRSLDLINNFIESVPSKVLGLVVTNANAGQGNNYNYDYQYY